MEEKHTLAFSMQEVSQALVNLAFQQGRLSSDPKRYAADLTIREESCILTVRVIGDDEAS